MNVLILGRRYERLLFLSAPISFVTLLLLFVAIASTSQTHRVNAFCFTDGAAIVEENLSELQSVWNKTTEDQSILRDFKAIEYEYKLSTTLIFNLRSGPSIGTQYNYNYCIDLLRDKVDGSNEMSPEEFIITLRNEAESLFSLQVPIKYWGVELPESTFLDLFGTTIKIEIMTLIQLIQFAVFPIMIIWLGSLYNTRYRESLLIGSAKQVSDFFPHIINVYPAGQLPQIRKRTLFLHHIPIILTLLFALWRVFLLTIIIAPAVIAYIYSLVSLESAGFYLLSYALAIIVWAFSFFVVFIEILPWHYSKIFPVLLRK